MNSGMNLILVSFVAGTNLHSAFGLDRFNNGQTGHMATHPAFD